MNIIFLTQQEHAFALMSARLSARGHTCRRLGTISDFMHFFFNMQPAADMFVCDYAAVQHEDLNLYNFEHDAGRKIPLIFYNDPYPADEERVAQWRSLNSRYLDIHDFSELIPVFEEIAAIVNSPAHRPYISVICPAKERGGARTAASGVPQEPDIIRSLPPSIRNILEYMHERLGQDVSIAELDRRIRKSEKARRAGAVYTYICRARSFLRLHPELGVYIQRTAKGFYAMRRT